MALYLVTGGAGFIGSHTVDALLRRGDSVRVLDNLSTGKLANLPSECTFMEGDIRDAETVRHAMQGVAGCIHLAAISSVQRSVEALAETHRINMSGAVQLFEQAIAIGVPVVYASSAAVYGDMIETMTIQLFGLIIG